MTKLKTLGRTTWDKIKIDEVFAENIMGKEWNICIKISEKHCHHSTSTFFNFENLDEWDDFHSCLFNDSKLYKLPLSVQRLWRED